MKPKPLAVMGAAAAVAFALVAGCSRDARLAEKDVRSVEVRTVSHYGVTLDEQATPEQVAYVLLRAIKEDFEADSDEVRQAALDRQFDICAADVIRAKNRTTISGDEFVYNVVYRWTPTVSHYVDNFQTDWEEAKARLVRSETETAEPPADSATAECEVLMELEDPSGDRNARVVMIIWMARDRGYWRVVHLGFDPKRRSLGG
jgi:hypothetical protein